MSKLKMSKWVKDFIRRRDKVCKRCGHKGSHKNRLTIHHKKPIRTHPHLIDNTYNCELLCRNCHDEVEKKIQDDKTD